MILSFHRRWITPIQEGHKVHTIREDKKNRWSTGQKIDGYCGNGKGKREKFFEDTCHSTQTISIVYGDNKLARPTIMVDGQELSEVECIKLAVNDGFNSLDDFLGWFSDDYKGKIIHWTGLRYQPKTASHATATQRH